MTTLKKFQIFLFFFILTSCGVKSPPVPPKNTALPSIIDKYRQDTHTATEEEKEEDNDETTEREP